MALEQFRGKPVVLTFLYTTCPDVCPLIADKLRQTSILLGNEAPNVVILALTTDPEHDDRTAATKFTQEHEMTGRWRFLLGSPQQLAPIWKSYYVGVTPVGQVTPSADDSAGSVIHSDPVYVIDRHGLERTLLGDDFEPRVLVEQLHKLVRES